MEITDLIDQLAADGTLLATAAEQAGWDAPVPTLDWTVRELVTHTGGVHRWAADIVTTASADLGTAAAAAVGTGDAEVSFSADFAQDGIRELVQGFARRKSNTIARPARMLLAAADGPSWTLTFGGERIAAQTAPTDEPTVTVHGSSSDLYLWLWNRPSAAQVDGDDSVAQLWHDTVQVRWG